MKCVCSGSCFNLRSLYNRTCVKPGQASVLAPFTLVVFVLASAHCVLVWTGVNCLLSISGPIADCASVALSHKTDNSCQMKRAAENDKRKAFFKLKSQHTNFPTLDLSTNQTIGVQLGNSLSDHWMKLYIHTIKFNRKLAGYWIFQRKQEFSSLGQYEAMFKWIIALQRVGERPSPDVST